MKASICLFVLVTLCPFKFSYAQCVLRPVDEANLKEDFLRFREQLKVVVAKHDVHALKSIISKDIMTSFGDEGNGVNGFNEMWEPEKSDSLIWETLAKVLALGGTFDDQGKFVAPYVFSRWPNCAGDEFSSVAILGNSVRMRATPSKDGKTVALLNYAIVETIEDQSEDGPWVQIRTAGGKMGYVAKELLRSPLDYRAFFQKAGGEWQMTMLVAGD